MSVEKRRVASRIAAPQAALLRSLQIWGVASLLYGAVAVFMTWPLAMHLHTHLTDTWVAAKSDTWFSAWILAHLSTVLGAGSLHFGDAQIYYPASDASFYGPMPFGALPIFAPTYLATGNPALALNLMFLFCIAFTAASFHLVVFWWTRSHIAGSIAAGTFLTTRWVLWGWIPCVPYYAALQYFPIIVYLAAQSPRRFSRAIRIVPFLVLQCLTSFYVTVAVLVPMSALVLVRVTRRATRLAGLQMLAAIVISMVLVFPAYAPYLAVRWRNPNLPRQTVWPMKLETEIPFGPFSYWAPTAVSAVTILLIALGALALLQRRSQGQDVRVELRGWMHAGFWTLTGLVLSLSPVVRWHGEAVTMPHAWLANWIPGADVIRTPARLGVAALMGLSILSGLAFYECGRYLRARRGDHVSTWRQRLAIPLLAACALLGMYFEYTMGAETPLIGLVRSQGYYVRVPPGGDQLEMPMEYLGLGPLPDSYPLEQAPDPESPLITRLRDSGGGPVLELPLVGQTIDGVLQTAGGGPSLQARAMYRSIFHGLPILNGYSSYWPDGFDGRMALAQRLPDFRSLRDLRRATGVESILVHLQELSPGDRRIWLRIGERGRADLRLVATDGDDMLFAVNGDALHLDSADEAAPAGRSELAPRESRGQAPSG
jgi:hypothetical protein